MQEQKEKDKVDKLAVLIGSGISIVLGLALGIGGIFIVLDELKGTGLEWTVWGLIPATILGLYIGITNKGNIRDGLQSFVHSKWGIISIFVLVGLSVILQLTA